MCSRSAAKTILADIRKTIQADLIAAQGLEEALPIHRINPTDPIPAIYHTPGQDAYTIGLTKWGFPAHKPGVMTWNARDDRLQESPMWSPHVGTDAGHCVLVVTHLFEAIDGADYARLNPGGGPVAAAYGRDKVWHAIVRNDGRPHLVPGLTTVVDEVRYTTMVTTEGGPVFGKVHVPASDADDSREVVSLRDWSEARRWLHPEAHPDWAGLLRHAGFEHVSPILLAPGAFKEGADVELRYRSWKPAQRGLF